MENWRESQLRKQTEEVNMLVHLTDEKNSRRIKRAGIVKGKGCNGVYFMPVTQNYFISHQWLREIRRNGARVLVGVYFRLPSDERVWAGRYYEPHQHMSLGEAIRILETSSEQLGYEMFVERKIKPSEIVRIRCLPQKIGWRYQPHAHGKTPCPCPICLPRGDIRSRSIRERYDPKPVLKPYEEIKAQISRETDVEKLIECLWLLQSKKRRIASPSFLERLMTIDDVELQEELAYTLAYFRHKDAKRMMLILCEYKSADVREAAAESLFQTYRREALDMLGPLSGDPVIGDMLTKRRLMYES